MRVLRTMRHHETWPEADLEDRLCRVLDVATRAVDALGVEGYSETDRD